MRAGAWVGSLGKRVDEWAGGWMSRRYVGGEVGKVCR